MPSTPFDTFDTPAPLDVSQVLQSGGPQAQTPQTGQQDMDDGERRKWTRLALLIPAIAKGGPGALQGLLAGMRQAQEARAAGAQQQQEQALAQRRVDLTERGQNIDLLLAQQREAQQRQQAAAKVLEDFRTELGTVTTDAEKRATVQKYQGLGLGLVRPGTFEREAATLSPTALQKREIEARLKKAHDTMGDEAQGFTYQLSDGTTLTHAQMLEAVNAAERSPASQLLTYGDVFPQVTNRPQVAGLPIPMKDGQPDLKSAADALKAMGVLVEPAASDVKPQWVTRNGQRVFDIPRAGDSDIKPEEDEPSADPGVRALAEQMARTGQLPPGVPTLQGEVAKDLASDPQLTAQYEETRMAPIRAQAQTILDAVDDLLEPQRRPNAPPRLTPGGRALFGPLTPVWARNLGIREGTVNANASLQQIIGQRVVDLIREMKGQSQTGATGFGQLNTRELDIILAAATRLTRRLGEPEAAQELAILREKFNKVMQPATGGAAPPNPFRR